MWTIWVLFNFGLVPIMLLTAYEFSIAYPNLHRSISTVWTWLEGNQSHCTIFRRFIIFMPVNVGWQWNGNFFCVILILSVCVSVAATQFSFLRFRVSWSVWRVSSWHELSHYLSHVIDRETTCREAYHLLRCYRLCSVDAIDVFRLLF